jgi:hypothetical protein
MTPERPVRAHLPVRARRRSALSTAAVVGAALIIGTGALAGCGSSSSTSTSNTSGSDTGAGGSTIVGAAAAPVLPVNSNPIVNTSTNSVLTIESVLVENNVDSTGAAVDDHLEIALSNTGSADVASIEVFTTFTDPTAGVTESYYTKLPDSFVVTAGGQAVVHFDNTGAAGHFPENAFSLYRTSLNAMDVTVVVSGTDAAVQTMTVQKDAGGDETAD